MQGSNDYENNKRHGEKTRHIGRVVVFGILGGKKKRVEKGLSVSGQRIESEN